MYNISEFAPRVVSKSAKQDDKVARRAATLVKYENYDNIVEKAADQKRIDPHLARKLHNQEIGRIRIELDNLVKTLGKDIPPKHDPANQRRQSQSPAAKGSDRISPSPVAAAGHTEEQGNKEKVKTTKTSGKKLRKGRSQHL